MIKASLGTKNSFRVGQGDSTVTGLDASPRAEEAGDEVPGLQPEQATVSVADAADSGCLKSATDKLNSAVESFSAGSLVQRSVVGSLVGGGTVSTITALAVTLGGSLSGGEAAVFTVMCGLGGGVVGALVAMASGSSSDLQGAPA